MSHTTTVDEIEFQLGELTVHLVTDWGTRNQKQLVWTFPDMFRVVDHDITIYEGKDVEAAVAAYNYA